MWPLVPDRYNLSCKLYIRRDIRKCGEDIVADRQSMVIGAGDWIVTLYPHPEEWTGSWDGLQSLKDNPKDI